MSSSFWLLQHPSTQPLAEDARGMRFETVTCSSDEDHVRDGRRLSELSVIAHPLGVKDFTWTWVSDILVSQRVLDVFARHRVTGFEVRPAKVTFPTSIKASPPSLFELIVTGW